MLETAIKIILDSNDKFSVKKLFWKSVLFQTQRKHYKTLLNFVLIFC